jgi:hypothetical protein
MYQKLNNYGGMYQKLNNYGEMYQKLILTFCYVE